MPCRCPCCRKRNTCSIDMGSIKLSLKKLGERMQPNNDATSPEEAAENTDWESLPEIEKLRRNVTYFMKKWTDSQKESCALRVKVASLEADLKDARWQTTEWRKAAEGWMADYDKLKNKYEPMQVVTSEAAQKGESK